MIEEPVEQPLLPRVGMLWFFIVAAVVALALGIVRAAEQGRAMAAAMVFTSIFFIVAAAIFGACFCIAYLFGATEKAIAGDIEKPSSPFIDGGLPQQIIPPKSADNS